MPFPPLTEKQRGALRAVVDHIREHGVAPTVVELSGAMGLSHGLAASSYLTALERRGYVRRQIGMARSIVVLLDEDGEEIEGLYEAA